ncbi:MAG: nuclear transport factor 2 family protein [Sphingomonadaceae bacterium]
MSSNSPLERVVRFYETLEAASVPQVRSIYAPDASFKDPFNEVRGHAAIVRIFEHMFVQVQAPRFVVLEQVQQGTQAFLTWEFRFHMRHLGRGEVVVRGASHLAFDDRGQVAMHRDYWDVAEELYEKLPLLGGLMRLLKRASRA